MLETAHHSVMPNDAHPDHSALAGCQRCHVHTQSHGCSGLLHGCNAQLAAARPSSLELRAVQLRVEVLAAALPRIATLAFDPPLRPPPA